jgi:hypothetical protein
MCLHKEAGKVAPRRMRGGRLCRRIFAVILIQTLQTGKRWKSNHLNFNGLKEAIIASSRALSACGTLRTAFGEGVYLSKSSSRRGLKNKTHSQYVAVKQPVFRIDMRCIGLFQRPLSIHCGNR